MAKKRWSMIVSVCMILATTLAASSLTGVSLAATVESIAMMKSSDRQKALV